MLVAMSCQCCVVWLNVQLVGRDNEQYYNLSSSFNNGCYLEVVIESIALEEADDSLCVWMQGGIRVQASLSNLSLSLTIVILVLHRFLGFRLDQQLTRETNLLLVLWRKTPHSNGAMVCEAYHVHVPAAILKKAPMWSSSLLTSVFSKLW